MRLFYLVLLFLLLAPAFAGAQAISINTDASNPDPSAILDVKSSVKGMLAPRMTTAQRTAIASPAAGLLVYDTDTDSFWYFDNGIWNQVASIALPPPIATGTNNTGIPIPDNNPTGITSIINLTQGGVIDASTRINVCIDITHTADFDLDISLIAPDGTTIDLSSDNGLFNNNYTNTCFTTALAPGITTNSSLAPFTGYWTPEQPFSNFINKPIPGNWTLKVVDDRNTDVGQLNWWSIEFPSVSIAPALLSDKDSDTKVQVEKNPDEDIIRFELSGTEGMVLRKTATGSPRLELTDGLANTFIGQSAGASNTTGTYNTANGSQALFSNTEGYRNTANGVDALYSNTIGFENTANGYEALKSNTTGNSNTAIGSQALFVNSTGQVNTAVGHSALYSNTTGGANTANGNVALVNNTTGGGNTAIGFQALASNTTGNGNTAIGIIADVTTGDLTNATAIGYNAKVGASNSLVLGGTGAEAVNVGVGTSIPAASALLDLTSTNKGMLVPRMTSAERTAIGAPATGLLVFDTDTNAFWFFNGTAWAKISPQTLLADAVNDTKVQVEKNPNEDIIRFDLAGTESMVLKRNTNDKTLLELPNNSNNIFIGTSAGNATSTGAGNVALGTAALYSNTDRSNLVAVGDSALYNNGLGATFSSQATNNTAIGSKALFSNTTGRENTAIGAQALFSNTTGIGNTANGFQALYSNTTGGSNIANGIYALSSNTGGTENTAIGKLSLLNNTTGFSNTAIGSQALFSNTTGLYNIGMGYNALFSNTTGSHNTAVGHDANVLSNNLTNATAIGYNAKVGASNSLVLGGTDAYAVNVGVGTSIPDASALLDLTSTSRGMLVPRMTSAQRTAIASPATGLLVFDTTTGGFWFFNGTAWVEISKTYVAGSGISVVGTTINNTGDVNAADDITTATAAGGDLAGTYPNPTVAANAIGSAEITNASIAVADLNFGTAAANQVLTATSATTAAWQAPAVQKILADADNNTKVQVEKNANEDIIRFDLAGTESMVLQKNAGGSPRLELPNALNNTFVGTSAGQANTTGLRNTANGRSALSSNTTGTNNTANGYQALALNTTGSENTATGSFALFSNTTGGNNTAYGQAALTANTTGSFNTANGQAALFANKANSRSTTLGYNAMYYADDRTTGRETFNTALGYEALKGSATAANNIGQYNTAVGDQALFSNTAGNGNTAIGSGTLFSNTSGPLNTANGLNALFSNTTGSGNTAIGKDALASNTTGSNNTALGNNSDVAANNLTNATAIGSTASVSASNKIRLGSAAVTVIEGQVAYTFPSDARFKFNIHDETVPGLAFINKLRPVTYQFDTRKFDEHLMQNMPDSTRRQRLAGQDYRESSAIVQTGFLAQEVEKACQELNFTFSGLHVPTSAVDNYGLAYGSFVPLLVKGMQEQQAVIEALKAENAAMKAQLDKITAALQTAGIGVEEK